MTQLDTMKQALDVLTSVCYAPNGDDWKLKREAESSLCTAIAEMEKAEHKKDAERYRELRRGQHWSVINGIGDVLRGDELDAAIDEELK